MYVRRDDASDKSHRKHPQSKTRDSARFRAALKITKYTPGHKDRPHNSHGGKPGGQH